MEDKVTVDWEKWEQQERPRLPWLVSVTIFSSILGIGVLCGFPFVGAGIGCVAIFTALMLLKAHGNYKY